MSSGIDRLVVKDLTKCYRVQHASQSVKEAISRGALGLFSGPSSGMESSEIYKVFDSVSFTVRSGDAVALVGPNGSGKSTFLKIVCRIVPPSSGSIWVNGRVAAMLEVGTGFHPELTGRENIFLAAAILGMDRKEISRKFDEIIQFSGVERHLDTPVKHFSSGMYVRLAFSVAVHSDPDVLIIDEVLAVGDQEFQSKCLAKITALRDSGVAILFVSHDQSLIEKVATRKIDISSGRNVEGK